MEQHKLFTSGKTTEAIDDRDVYLMLITKELCSHHNAHSIKQYYSVPDRLVRDYMKYKKKDRQILHTALRKLDGYNGETFEKPVKDKLREKYEEERDKALEELLTFTYESISGRSKRISFNTVRNSHIKNKPLMALLKKKEENNEVELLFIPTSVLDNVERKINEYSKREAKLRALKYVEDHIILTGEYKFRVLVDSVEQIFELMFVEGEYSKVDPEEALSDLKKLVYKAMKNYEVYDNIDFILNSDSFYQSISTTFKKKLTKIKDK